MVKEVPKIGANKQNVEVDIFDFLSRLMCFDTICTIEYLTLKSFPAP